MEDFTIIRINTTDRNLLNTMSDAEERSQIAVLHRLIEAAWNLYVQDHCPHVWQDASTGSGDCVEEHSVCKKCGLLQ